MADIGGPAEPLETLLFINSSDITTFYVNCLDHYIYYPDHRRNLLLRQALQGGAPTDALPHAEVKQFADMHALAFWERKKIFLWSRVSLQI